MGLDLGPRNGLTRWPAFQPVPDDHFMVRCLILVLGPGTQTTARARTLVQFLTLQVTCSLKFPHAVLTRIRKDCPKTGLCSRPEFWAQRSAQRLPVVLRHKRCSKQSRWPTSTQHAYTHMGPRMRKCVHHDMPFEAIQSETPRRGCTMCARRTCEAPPTS